MSFVFYPFSCQAGVRSHWVARLLVALAVLCVSVSFVHAEEDDRLPFTSVADYEEYRSPYMFVALHASSPKKDAYYFTSGKEDFKLEILITGDRVSYRRLRMLFLEGLSINNDSATFLSMKKDLETFFSTFDGSIYPGDRIILEHQVDQNSRLLLNNTRKLVFQKENFAPFLLSALIGDVPLTTPFKAALLDFSETKKARKAWNRFAGVDSVRPVVASVPTPKSNTTKPEPKTQTPVDVPPEHALVDQNAGDEVTSAAVNKPPQKTPLKPDAAVANKTDATDELSTDTITPPRQATATESKPDNSVNTSQSIEDGDSRVPTDAAVAEVVKPEQNRDVAATTAQQDSTLSDKSEETPVVASEVTSETQNAETEFDAIDVLAFSETALEARNAYFNQLEKSINKYKTVPFQAYQKRWEDHLSLSVSVSRDGRLLDVHFIKESKYKLFNKQAQTAVEKAAPFPPFPRELPGKSQTFRIQLDYRLAR